MAFNLAPSGYAQVPIPGIHQRLVRTRSDSIRDIADELLNQKPFELDIGRSLISVGDQLSLGPQLYPTGSAGLKGIYTNLLPGTPLEMEPELATLLEDFAINYMKSFPWEATSAALWYGKPFMWGRFDMAVRGTKLSIWELDDQAAHIALLRILNPIAFSHFLALQWQLHAAGHPLLLVEQPDPKRGTVEGYHTDQEKWIPLLVPSDMAAMSSDPMVVLLGRRYTPEFDRYNRAWKSWNALPGRYRDYKGTLAAVGQGVIVEDIDLAVQVCRHALNDLQKQRVPEYERAVVIKGLGSARVEQV